MFSLFRRSASRREELERRRLYIESYSFPPALRERIAAHSELALTSSQLSLVLDGLRAWFVACLHAGGKTLGMPSRAVDLAWHEFILMTREYRSFCDEAFGYYLHHTPEQTMSEPMPAALQRTLLATDRQPAFTAYAGIPLLFALDSQLGLTDGQTWTQEDLDQLRAQESDGGSFTGFWGGDGTGSGDGGGSGDGSGGGSGDESGSSCGGGASCGGAGGCGGGSG
jgi:hypothetical protein